MKPLSGLLRDNGLRLRLTALYGGLFALTGAALLAITYVLVTAATDQSGKVAIAVPIELGQAPPTTAVTVPDHIMRRLDEALRQQHDTLMRQLLLNSGIALVLVTVVAVLLGWFLAGRLLRPLRTITATARDISATDLHRRLALSGSNDEIKHLGDTIDGLLARLESAFEAQRRFIANASHELRTPLARQRAIGQLAVSDPAADIDTLRQAHDRVLAAGDQQRRIIDALLTLARGQAGPDHLEPLDLAAITGDAIAARTHLADERAVTIAADLPEAWTVGDPQLVSQLVGNLIDNAILHNVPDGRLTVTTSSDGEHSVLTVGNTGPDIAEDQLDQITQPFRRAGTDRTSHEGTGLGLSIVQAIADAHGATLTLARGPGGGLSATVSFPAGDQ